MKNQLKRKRKIEILKKNGVKQRSDVGLSLPIVSALKELIFSGKTIYPKSGKIEYIEIDNNGVEIAKKVSKHTVMSWLRRGNVIPETGETLRDVLDRIKGQYRTKKQEERREKFLSDADREINRTLNIRSNVFVRDKSGNKIIDRDTGEFVREENPHLLKTKVDIAKFVKERLDPVRWGSIQKVEGKHLHVFSLADLRKAKKAKEMSNL